MLELLRRSVVDLVRHIQLVAALARLAVWQASRIAAMTEGTGFCIFVIRLCVETALNKLLRLVRIRQYAVLHVARSAVALLVAWANTRVVAVLVNRATVYRNPRLRS